MGVNTDEAGRWYYNSARNFTVDKYSLILNLPQDEAVKDIGLIKSLPDVAFLMLTSILYDMQYYQGCSALLKKYKEMRDRLSPDLVEILEADYGGDGFPPHGVLHPDIIVQQMIESGELDLTSFKDENGVVSYSKLFSENQFIFYPLPYYMGGLESLRKKLPTMRMQARLEIDDAIRMLKEKNVSLEPVRAFVKRIEERHNARKGKVPTRRFMGIMLKSLDKTILVNYRTKQYFFLKPYAEDLRSLFDVSVSWSFLRQYMNAVNNALGETSTAPSTGEYDGAFVKMFNSIPTNTLLSMNFDKAKPPTLDEIKATTEPQERTAQYNLYTNKWEYKDRNTEVLIPATPDEIRALQRKDNPVAPNLPLFNNVTWRLMLFLNICFTQQNTRRGDADKINNVVESDVVEYMNTAKIKTSTANIKKTTLRLKQELNTLGSFQLKHTDKKYSLDMVTPYAEVSLKRGRIRVTFAPSFANYLANIAGFLTTFPIALLQGNVNNPNFLPLGYYLAWYRSYDNNIRLGKANIISVTSCLDKCPCIPKIDAVKAWNGSPFYKIITPFCDTLDILEEKGVLKSWEFCGAKGTPIPRATVDKYDYFTELYILFEIKDFPTETEVARIKEHDDKKRRRKERQERFTDREIAKRIANKTVQ